MPSERPELMQRKVIARDFPLVALALLLSVFGILMVYSAGQTNVPTVVASPWRSPGHLARDFRLLATGCS